MRKVETQHRINEKALFSSIKKLQTSLNYVLDDNKKGIDNIRHLEHVAMDSMSTAIWMEKYILLRMMLKAEEPDDRYDDA
jgi:hypothetical protein